MFLIRTVMVCISTECYNIFIVSGKLYNTKTRIER